MKTWQGRHPSSEHSRRAEAPLINFNALLARHATIRPDAAVLIDDAGTLSYGELWSESNRVAGLLHLRGAKPGDRLGLWLPNCSAWLTTFMACARLGVTVISMNTRFRGREVGDLMRRGQCRWLVTWPDFKGLPFKQILGGVDRATWQALEGVMVVSGHGPVGADIPDELQPSELIPGIPSFHYATPVAQHSLQDMPVVSGETDALIYTTSGTTSQPKLVVHDQQTLLRHGESVASYFDIGERDVVLLGAPLCGAFGFSSALGALAAGASMVSSPVLTAAHCASQMQQYQVTHTFANNELLHLILAAVAQAPRPFPSLRLAGFASFAPSLDDFTERAERAGMRLIGLYGSSELQALVAGQPPEAPLTVRQQAGGCLVAPDSRVRVRDIETGDVLPHGEVGELEIRAPSLMRRYLDDPKATAAAIDAEGYFKTGDLGHTVDERCFVFHARRGDFLRLGGFLVNPKEIEQFIEKHQGVVSCQVVGASYQQKTVPVAFITIEPGHTVNEGELIAACKAELAGFKVPKRIGIVETFPVVESANSNKIQKGKLQQEAERLLAQV